MKLYSYPSILTVEDVIGILKIGRNQCYDLLNNGTLKAFKLGTKTWKIPRESVEEFISTSGYSRQPFCYGGAEQGKENI